MDAKVERVKSVLCSRLEADEFSLFEEADIQNLTRNGFLNAEAFASTDKEILRDVLPQRGALVGVLLKAFVQPTDDDRRVQMGVKRQKTEFREGLLAARKCLPIGSSVVLGSTASDVVNTNVVVDSWCSLDKSGAFERFWLDHSLTLQEKTYETMRCFESSTDIPAYQTFGQLLSDIAIQIGNLLGGPNLLVDPVFLVPPESTLLKSAGSDGKLIPDVIWSPTSSLNVDTCEVGCNIFGEMKTCYVNAPDMKSNFKEANGQLLKTGMLVYGRMLEKYDLETPYQVTGMASDGIRVQVCYTSYCVMEKPSRLQTCILEIVDAASLQNVNDSAMGQRTLDNRRHQINTRSNGFKEIVFAIFRCLHRDAMQARSQESKDVLWREEEHLCVKKTDGYMIGNNHMHLVHAGGKY